VYPMFLATDPVEAIPGLFPACAVICAMAKRAQVEQMPEDGEQVDEVLEEIVPPRVPVELDIPAGNDLEQERDDVEVMEEAGMSTQMLVSKQKNDPELQKLKEQAVSEDETSKVPVCYYVKNNVLMRK